MLARIAPIIDWNKTFRRLSFLLVPAPTNSNLLRCTQRVEYAKVKARLKRHKRFHIHFTPTSSLWLNVIERWFRDISVRRIRRGVFKSVSHLIEAIMDYVNHHNNDPQTITRTAKAADILEKVTRAKAALDKTPSV